MWVWVYIAIYTSIKYIYMNCNNSDTDCVFFFIKIITCALWRHAFIDIELALYDHLGQEIVDFVLFEESRSLQNSLNVEFQILWLQCVVVVNEVENGVWERMHSINQLEVLVFLQHLFSDSSRYILILMLLQFVWVAGSNDHDSWIKW